VHNIGLNLELVFGGWLDNWWPEMCAQKRKKTEKKRSIGWIEPEAYNFTLVSNMSKIHNCAILVNSFCLAGHVNEYILELVHK
jgi:hypothetical protein